MMNRLSASKRRDVRPTLYFAAFCGSAAFATGAQAQEVNFFLNAEVDPFCAATTPLGENIEIDLGILSQTPTGSEVSSSGDVEIIYVCNGPEGFTRTISSLNEGVLVRVGSAGGDGNEIPYFVEATGSEGLDFSRTQFAQPQTRTFSGSTAFLNGVSGTLTVFVNGVLDGGTAGDPTTRTTVFAGQYTDVLTVAVTAN